MTEKKKASDRSSALRRRAEDMMIRQLGEPDQIPSADVRRMFHELQVHQIELELQNDELRRTQQELETSREKYFDLYDLAPVGYVTLKEKGIILEANLTAAALLGKVKNDLVKMPFSRFIHREDQDIYYLHIKQLLQTRQLQECEVRMSKGNGTLFGARLETLVTKGNNGEPTLRTMISDTPERKRAEKAILESERRERERAEAQLITMQRFYNILSNMYSGILLVSDSGHVEFANRSFCDLFGLDDEPTDLVGHAHYAIIEKIKHVYLHPEEAVARIREVLDCGQPVIGEEIAIQGGKTFLRDFVSLNIDEKSYGRVWIHFDITQRKQAEEEIKKLNETLSVRNEELEFANKEMESFVYSVSHDLRAPLRQISGFADLLAKTITGRLDEKEQRYFSNILGGSEKMSRLIDDLLNLSNISRREIRRKKVNISTIAASTIAKLREACPGRRVEVDIKEGITVFTDPGLIEIVLSNLLGNAWKFTAKTEHASIAFGTIEQDGKIIYYVKDNGAGFNQEYAEKMFPPFQRLHLESEFEGTGIGLAIVDRIIRCHEGKVWAEGIKGEGATIYFSLP